MLWTPRPTFIRRYNAQGIARIKSKLEAEAEPGAWIVSVGVSNALPFRVLRRGPRNAQALAFAVAVLRASLSFAPVVKKFDVESIYLM